MEDCAVVDNSFTNNQEPSKVHLHEQNSSTAERMQEVENIMEVLTRVDLDLTCSSEKLINLHLILMHLSAWDNDLEAMAIAATSIVKALEFDLLSGILDSEVRGVENFVDNLQAEIADVRREISSCRCSTELLSIMEEKLHDSEESLKKTWEQVFEVKMQAVKLQRTFSVFKLENWEDDKALELPLKGQLSKSNAYSRRQMAEQQRHILRMLEKSLARELDLEKKLSELRQNEEQLKLKLFYTEQVAFRMEEAAEVVWGRFLEAENASEVLMGISKEMVGRLQIVQFNLNDSFQQEAELKLKIEDCIRQLDAKDSAIKKLENSIAEHIARSSEVPVLTEKVKSLEGLLEKSKLRLKNANALNEETQEQLSEMENVVETLKESVYEAESRAENAESKAAQLTETNLELTEEINFLKGNRESDAEKVTLIEKQLRDLEIQLQHSKVSSEASQEQQNMLYSAIWDMETLIEDLKSKVAKAESKTENAEEQCIILSEANFELNDEISLLKSRVKSLETSLDQANKSKTARAKEINQRIGLMMDTVMQLAKERDRVQNQVISLKKENKILVEKLRNDKRGASVIMCNTEEGDDENRFASENVSIDETYGKDSETAASLSKTFQDLKDIHLPESKVRDSKVSSLETFKLEKEGSGLYIVKATFVALFAMFVIYLLHKKPAIFDKIELLL